MFRYFALRLFARHSPKRRNWIFIFERLVRVEAFLKKWAEIGQIKYDFLVCFLDERVTCHESRPALCVPQRRPW